MAIFRVPFNITFPGAGSPGANIFHIRTAISTAPEELLEANALVSYIRTLYTNAANYMPTGTTITLGTVSEEGTQREIVPTFSAVTGSGTGSSMQALALVITWRTTVAARRGRGRTFIGPLATATVQADGTPADTFRATMATAAAGLVSSSMAYGNGAIGVWGYAGAKGSGTPRDPNDPRVFRDFTGSNVRDLFGVLRSRRD
jgi:hypothetical protein